VRELRAVPSSPADDAPRAGAAPPDAGFFETVRRNAVALISLFVALSGLGYNTWRNETTEAHRNVRQAAFVILETLGELQQVVDQRYYAGKRTDTNRIAGWGKIAMVRDLGMLVTPETSRQATRLFDVWRERLDELDAGDIEAEREISQAIAATREQVLRDLEALR
jgi:hypothetical protein